MIYRKAARTKPAVQFIEITCTKCKTKTPDYNAHFYPDFRSAKKELCSNCYGEEFDKLIFEAEKNKDFRFIDECIDAALSQAEPAQTSQTYGKQWKTVIWGCVGTGDTPLNSIKAAILALKKSSGMCDFEEHQKKKWGMKRKQE